MSQRITFYTTLVQREKLDEWLEKQKSIGSFVLPIQIVLLVNISSMSYLESEQQDETRNVTEYDSEKAAVTDTQETCMLHRFFSIVIFSGVNYHRGKISNKRSSDWHYDTWLK